MLTIFVFFNKEVCKWPSHEPFDRNWSSLASLQLGVQKLFNNFVKNIYVIFFAFWNPCESVGWCNNELTDIFSQSNDGIICEHFKQCFWHYLSVFSTRNQNHIWITTGARIRMLQGIFFRISISPLCYNHDEIEVISIIFWQDCIINLCTPYEQQLTVIVHCTHADCKLITLIVSNYKLHYHKVRGENTSYSFIICNYLTFPN